MRPTRGRVIHRSDSGGSAAGSCWASVGPMEPELMPLHPPTVLIDSPSSLVAATPALLGYLPAGELLAWVLPGAGRAGTQVVSLGPPRGIADAGAALAAARELAGSGATRILLLAWLGVPDHIELVDLPSTRPVGELIWALAQFDLAVEGAYTTNGRVAWVHLCRRCDEHEPGGCPSRATPLDPATVLAVQAELVGAGTALPQAGRLPDLGPDEQLQAAVSAALPAVGPGPTRGDLEAWRDAAVDWASELLGPPVGGSQEIAPGGLAGLTTPDVARLLVALADVRVRDTVMFRLGLWGPWDYHNPQRLEEVLALAVRGAPDSLAAAPATLLGISCWLSGRAESAAWCLRRASEADPGYNLCRLAGLMVDSSLTPQVWRSGLLDLTELECRTGQADSASMRRRAARVRPARRRAN